MTHANFFKHFDLLADQPDAVAKMRAVVLQLAVQGRLTAARTTPTHLLDVTLHRILTA